MGLCTANEHCQRLSSSTIKRTPGHAVRARAWYREFRAIVLMCAVYNIKRVVKQ